MTIEIRRILVPTDFSEHSAHALKYGIAMAEKFGAELHLLHAYQDLAVYQPDAVTVEPSPAPIDALMAAARTALAKLVQDHQLERFHAKTEVVEGSPVEEIVDYAHHHKIDLIVIATHGRGWLAHLLMGSVAEKVVRKAPCPVMAVHLPDESTTA